MFFWSIRQLCDLRVDPIKMLNLKVHKINTLTKVARHHPKAPTSWLITAEHSRTSPKIAAIGPKIAACSAA